MTRIANHSLDIRVDTTDSGLALKVGLEDGNRKLIAERLLKGYDAKNVAIELYNADGRTGLPHREGGTEQSARASGYATGALLAVADQKKGLVLINARGWNFASIELGVATGPRCMPPSMVRK